MVNQLAQISGIGTNLTLNELQARGSLRQRELQSILAAPIPDVAAPGRFRAEGLGQVGGTLQQLGGVGIGFGLGGPAPAVGKRPERRAGDFLPTPQPAPAISLGELDKNTPRGIQLGGRR